MLNDNQTLHIRTHKALNGEIDCIQLVLKETVSALPGRIHRGRRMYMAQTTLSARRIWWERDKKSLIFSTIFQLQMKLAMTIWTDNN